MPDTSLKSWEEWRKAAIPGQDTYANYQRYADAVKNKTKVQPGPGGVQWIGRPSVTMSGGMPSFGGGVPGMGAQFNPGLMSSPMPVFGGLGAGGQIPGLNGGGKGFVGGINDWLNENIGGGITDVLGLGLGAYGMYQQGKAQDRQQDLYEQQAEEERRRYEDERKRKGTASMETAPMVKGIWDELQAQLQRSAAGR